jgi:nicotinamide-nucleotide amidase
MLHNVQLVKLLQSRNMKLALAESMTCGEAAGRLASVQGTADVLLCSVVCYHESAKTCLLKVSRRTLKKFSAESQETTDAMTKTLKKLLNADVYAAVTGLASAGGSETKRKPVGTVFFSIIIGKKLHRVKKKFNGSPSEIRKKACDFLYREIVALVR